MNPLVIKFKAPLYRTPIWIIVHRSIPKAIDFIEDIVDYSLANKRGRSSLLAYAVSLEDAQGCQRSLLFIRPSSKPGEIAHECKHLINQIFGWYGVKLSLSKDEHECYYLEWLVDKVHYVISKYKKLHLNKASYTHNAILSSKTTLNLN